MVCVLAVALPVLGSTSQRAFQQAASFFAVSRAPACDRCAKLLRGSSVQKPFPRGANGQDG
eukprot:10387123-Lingulodinium_polyedra.AAC.1